MPPSRATQLDESVVVELPTLSNPEHRQKVVGRRSAIVAEVEEFRGIPYGTVAGRWQHSIVAQSLPNDVFDATHNGPKCTQPPESNNTDGWQSHLDFPSDVAESEFDCLNLFISRPGKIVLQDAGLEDQAGKLPVYVYIHGGGFCFGAGTDPMWDPARLVWESVNLKRPIIAVSINYRLNVFGFTASSDILQSQPDSDKGCNFALVDQRTAIEWVAHNIAAFGGDPQKITVGGQSAGAVSSHVHVLDAISSSQRPLLRRAIVQSAAVHALGPQPLSEEDRRWWYLCKHFGVEKLPPQERVKKLASVPAAELLEAGKRAGWYTFSAVDDGYTIVGVNELQWKVSLGRQNTQPIRNDLRDRKRPIDVLVGDTDAEGSVYYDVIAPLKSFAPVEKSIQSSSASKIAVHDILSAYHLDSTLTQSALFDALCTFLTDLKFGIPVERARLSLDPSSPLQKQYTHPTKSTGYRVEFGNPWPGPFYDRAQHCVDLIYIYDCFHDALRKADTLLDRKDPSIVKNEAMVNQIQQDWIEFISSDDPKIEGVIESEPLIVYGHNRVRKVVIAGEDANYVERRKRFDVLEKYWQDALIIAIAIKSALRYQV